MCVCVGMYIYIYIMKAGDETRAVLASAAAERGRWFPSQGARQQVYIYTIYRYIDI